MFRFWGKIRSTIKHEKRKVMQPATSVIVVVIHGGQVDRETIRLACLMAKAASSKLYLLTIIEVPRTLPLEATHTRQYNMADEMLQQGLVIAKEEGCDDSHAEVIQAREADAAIVEVVKDRACSLLVFALVRDSKNYRAQSDWAMSVMRSVPCRVLLVQNTSNEDSLRTF